MPVLKLQKVQYQEWPLGKIGSKADTIGAFHLPRKSEFCGWSDVGFKLIKFQSSRKLVPQLLSLLKLLAIPANNSTQQSVTVATQVEFVQNCQHDLYNDIKTR